MIIAYLRASVSKQQIEDQRSDLENYASEKGVQISKWLTEVADGRRKEQDHYLRRVIDRMQAGDVLMITDVSRLGRTLSDVMAILSHCTGKGVHVCSVKDRYLLDTSLDLRVISSTFSLVAELEHHLMSSRTSEALAHKKTTGGTLGRPKGTDAKQSMLEENKEEVINMLERGDTVVEICKRFNVSRNTYYQFRRNYSI